MNDPRKGVPIPGRAASVLVSVVFAFLLSARLSANPVQGPSGTSAIAGSISEDSVGAPTVPLQDSSVLVAGGETGDEPVATRLGDINVGQSVSSISENWLSERLRSTWKPPSRAYTSHDDAIGAARPGSALSNTWLLPTLYLTFGVLQGADAYTTHVALKGGAREVNPTLRWAAKNPGALIAVKAASTIGTIYLLEKLRLRNRRATLITTAAIDICYTAIVAHNATLGVSSERRLRSR